MKIDIVTRFLNEHIYFDHFVNYYLGIGIDHIHILWQKDQESICFDNKNVTIVKHDYLGNDVISHTSELITTNAEYVLLCDFDEYLYLKNFKTIQDYLLTIPSDIDQILFQWAMVENFSYMTGKQDIFDTLSSQKIYANRYVKPMIKLNLLSKYVDPHSINSNKTLLWNQLIEKPRSTFDYDINNYINTEIPFFIHFHTRSLQNIFVKGITTALTNSNKLMDKDKLLKLISNKNIENKTAFTKLQLPFCHTKTNEQLQINIKINTKKTYIDFDDENKQLEDICNKNDIDFNELLETIKLFHEKYSAHFKL
jgi:hypothetical protein